LSRLRVSSHQRHEQAIERRLVVDEKCGCFTRVEASPSGKRRQAIDERLAETKKSFDRVTQRCTAPRRRRTVFARMSLGDREIATFNVEVSQEIADELHATLAESNALVFGQIGQPGSVLTLGRKRSGATVCASHLN